MFQRFCQKWQKKTFYEVWSGEDQLQTLLECSRSARWLRARMTYDPFFTEGALKGQSEHARGHGLLLLAVLGCFFFGKIAWCNQWIRNFTCFSQPCALPVCVISSYCAHRIKPVSQYARLCNHLCNLTLKPINLILWVCGVEWKKDVDLWSETGLVALLSWMIIHHRGQDCLDTVLAENCCMSFLFWVLILLTSKACEHLLFTSSPRD